MTKPPFPIFASILTLIATVLAAMTALFGATDFYFGGVWLVWGTIVTSVPAGLGIVLAILWSATRTQGRILWLALAILLPPAGCLGGFGYARLEAKQKVEDDKALARRMHAPEQMVSHADRCPDAARPARCASLGKPTCYYWCDGCTVPTAELPKSCVYDTDNGNVRICCSAPVVVPP